MSYRKTFAIIGTTLIVLGGAFIYLSTTDTPLAFADDTGATGAGTAQGNTTCGNDNWAWSVSATDLQTNDTSYAQQTTNRWDNGETSDQLDALNYGFSGLTGTIDGIQVRVYGWSPSGDANTFATVQLTTDGGTTLIGTNQAAGAMSTSDDDSYDTFGGSTDDWSASLTPSDINSNSNFGVSICWTSVANDTTANIDHVEMTVWYTPSAGEQQIQRQDVFFF